MFRFSIRSLLMLIAVVALWLSTIAFYEGAHDVRTLLMLSVLVASGVAVTKYDGRRRAFWVGFFLTVLTTGLDGKLLFSLPWAERLLNDYGIRQNLPNGSLDPAYFFAKSTIHAAVLLLIATGMGLLGVLVFGLSTSQVIGCLVTPDKSLKSTSRSFVRRGVFFLEHSYCVQSRRVFPRANELWCSPKEVRGLRWLTVLIVCPSFPTWTVRGAVPAAGRNSGRSRTESSSVVLG